MSSEFIPDQTKVVEVIPQDLKEQFSACRATSTALALFDQGYFSPRHAMEIPKVAAFLTTILDQAMDQALAHPQAHMISELKNELDKRKAKNGQAKDAN